MTDLSKKIQETLESLPEEKGVAVLPEDQQGRDLNSLIYQVEKCLQELKGAAAVYQALNAQKQALASGYASKSIVRLVYEHEKCASLEGPPTTKLDLSSLPPHVASGLLDSVGGQVVSAAWRLRELLSPLCGDS